MINSNLPPILHRLRDIAFDRFKIAIIWLHLLRLIPGWSGFLHHMIISDISLKSRSFGLHFRRRKFGNIFNHFYAVCPECYRFRYNKSKLVSSLLFQCDIRTLLQDTYNTKYNTNKIQVKHTTQSTKWTK